jgi:CHRD domain
MKKLWMLPIFSLVFTSTQIISSASAIAATLFQAKIDVEQEVCSKPAEPCPTTSDATGFFSAELNDAENTLKYTFNIDGLDLGFPIGTPQTADSGDDIIKVHIHLGSRGVAGPVVFAPLDLTMGERDNDLAIVAPDGIIGGTLSGIWTLSEGLQDQLGNLKSEQLYVNIHSSRFLANGELRGQITKAPEPTMLVGLALVGTVGFFISKRQRN